MSLYYSVTVSRRLVCNCSAYKFPHVAASANCSTILPDDLDSVPVRVSYTSMKRAKDLIRDGYL
jgi:hypothetical protein